MATYGTYRITVKKCCTCSYWKGEREIKFSRNKPYYINAMAGSSGCMANQTKAWTANDWCLKWRMWEKIS